MKPNVLSACLAAAAAIAMPAFAVTQTKLDPATLTKYLDPLPAPARLDGTLAQTITMTEFSQQVLPSNFSAGPYAGKTLVWGYNGSYPGPTIVAKRGTKTTVTWVNSLNNPALLPYLPIDQTLHWADPLKCMQASTCATKPYTGPVPVVPHLHGGEIPSAFDGHPNGWFTPGNTIKGSAFVTNVYQYPNMQEATTLWYHDHTLGITRLNVYAGLAGFYLLRDSANELATLPSGSYEREIVFQDRMFDTNGQLLYPTSSSSYSTRSSGSTAFWIEHFLGDVAVVNGKAWPVMKAEPRRYRLRLLNGSTSRIYNLSLQTTTGSAGPAFWVIGTDGGQLAHPIQASTIVMAPGERMDVIVDFSASSGKGFILKNGDNHTWSGSGTSGSLTELMKFDVSLPLAGTDTSLVPSSTANLRPNNALVSLSATVNSGTPVRNMTLEKDRNGGGFLLNGKPWADAVSEMPRVGATEVWNIDNHTGDTHPIHLHLVQFQIRTGGSGYTSSYGSSSNDPALFGWKDTIRVEGWGSTTIVVRWAPQNVTAGGVQPGQNFFPFSPMSTPGTTDGWGYPGGSGYVWHCHIIEHEDNEMMRPYLVQP
jgi:spore coat protein A, manganese oxidase